MPEPFSPDLQKPYQQETANNADIPTLFRPHTPKTLGFGKVVVTPDLTNPRNYHIAWTAQTRAVKYTVWITPSPMFANKNKFKDVVKTQTALDFSVPQIIPDDVKFFVWVSFQNPSGQDVFISKEPSYTEIVNQLDKELLSPEIERDVISGKDMTYYAEEIRRRHLAILENDGEPFQLFIRRVSGMMCICKDPAQGNVQRPNPEHTMDLTALGSTIDLNQPDEFEENENNDPTYQTTARCDQCFGTGIAGGFFPHINTIMRYGNLPVRTIRSQELGLEFSHNFNAHTIWHPPLKEKDLVVRVRTGERFVVKEPGKSEFRGLVLHQAMNLANINRNDIEYQVNDDTIVKALNEESVFNFATWDWSVFR